MTESKTPTTVSFFLAALLAVALGIGCFAAGWGVGYATGRNEKSNFDRSIELAKAALNSDRSFSGNLPERIAELVNSLNNELDAIDENNDASIQTTEQSSVENTSSNEDSGQFRIYLKKQP